jgi:glyoxylate carboligase
MRLSHHLLGAALSRRRMRRSICWDARHRLRELGGSRCDCLIALGARFDDRVTGNPKKFAPQAKVIHVDIDQAELGKIRVPQVPILGDVKTVIKQLTAAVQTKQHGEWNARIAQWKKETPLDYPKEGKLKPQFVLQELQRLTDGEAIMTTDVGQHQMFAAQYYHPRRTRSFITSGGLGTMGYGYPAAIGAKVGCIVGDCADREVWCITGDGSFQMNIRNWRLACCTTSGESRGLEQLQPGHGSPVAEDVLRKALERHRLGQVPRLRQSRGSLFLHRHHRDARRRSGGCHPRIAEEPRHRDF